MDSHAKFEKPLFHMLIIVGGALKFITTANLMGSVFVERLSTSVMVKSTGC